MVVKIGLPTHDSPPSIDMLLSPIRSASSSSTIAGEAMDDPRGRSSAVAREYWFENNALNAEFTPGGFHVIPPSVED